MSKESRKPKKFGAQFKTVNLDRYFNWPKVASKDPWWRALAEAVLKYPAGPSWGIPFLTGSGKSRRVLLLRQTGEEISVSLRGQADYVCVLHTWEQIPSDIKMETPREGLVVGEYVLTYSDGTQHVQPVRARFEVTMAESPGPPFLSMYFNMWESVDACAPPKNEFWGQLQPGVRNTRGKPLVHAMKNPHPDKDLKSIRLRGCHNSPLIVAGITLYQGQAHPLQHLPRRLYKVSAGKGPVRITQAEVDLGAVTRLERAVPRSEEWLESPYIATQLSKEPEDQAQDLVEIFGAPDATVSLKIKGRTSPEKFSLGQVFREGEAFSISKKARLEVLGKTRQWMKITVRDEFTGKPTPVRCHMSGSQGEYLAPYGHHSVVNANWFEDYGADVVAGGRQYAYVSGEFISDLPVGEIFVELTKGFEYEPVRQRIVVKPGQKDLDLSIRRWKDLRALGWVTADTHVHFISPHTAWLEGQCEGVNVVNLLASQWGRLFTNVGDLTGRLGIAENDTLVYVGTENRNHMLGHMSMLGTKGLPVYPMCGGGPSESWVGDPDFRALAEWAAENRRKGGVVIRPHFPYCGCTEDPVPILSGLVDALEIGALRGEDFPTQEWYRYLNCGYRVAVAGGTDKMGANCALGWLRTYAQLDRSRPFTYDAWAEAVRSGRTFATNGPLIDFTLDGHGIGITVDMSGPGTLEAVASAHSFWPLGKIEIVQNGKVIATEQTREGQKGLSVKCQVDALRSGWVAARCSGVPGHPAGYVAAHTSPIYLQVGDSRAFDGPAAEHMLNLMQGAVEYMQTLSTAYDEPSRKRMVKLFKEVQSTLKSRRDTEV